MGDSAYTMLLMLIPLCTAVFFHGAAAKEKGAGTSGNAK